MLKTVRLTRMPPVCLFLSERYTMTPLRQRLIEDLQVRNYSPRTVECYVRHVAAFARHFQASPEQLGPEQIRAYQVYLVQQKHASWSLFNQAACALRFFSARTRTRSLSPR